MNKLYKWNAEISRIMISLLVLSLLLQLIPSNVDAAGSVDTGNDTGISFETGTKDIIFISNDQTAKTGTRYKTIGWLVRTDATDGSYNGITCTAELDAPLSGDCNPLKDSNWIRLDMGPGGFQLDSTDTWSQPGRTISKFRMRASDVEAKFKMPSALKDVTEGKTIYFNSIFEVTINGISQPGEYTTLSSIRTAKDWANKSGFRQYFDLSVTYTGLPQPLNKKWKVDATRADLKPVEQEPNPADPLGWPAGPDSESITLDQTLVSGADTYKLVCSYQQPTVDNTFVNCNTETEDPYYVRWGPTTVSRNPGIAIGGTDLIMLYKKVDDTTCACIQNILLPDKDSTGGIVTGSTISKQLPVQIDMKQPPSGVDDWKTFLDTRKDIKIRIQMWRSDVVKGNSGNTGAAPIWTPVGSPALGSYQDISEANLLKLLGGETPPTYNDNLMSYPIAEGQNVNFRYNATIDIMSTHKTLGTTATITCSAGASVEIPPFIRPAKKPDQGHYTSKPQYWSEIKQGSPQMSGTGSDEEFEAMAGTPTNRNLYFASGGSEFIVDITTEYVPKVTQTRNYKSEFFSVVNGWAMSPINNVNFCTDCSPSAPTPRTKVDACGSPYTETVTAGSRSYTVGSPPGPVVAHTDRWYDQGGYDSHMVGGYTDTWTQTVTFDYMKITKANVWKLDKSKVNGMTNIIGTNEVTASVVQGDPNIFYHVSNTQDSAGGRLRYSLETDQHDNVYWPEGNSDNCLANSKTGAINEQAKFTERRNLTTNVTAVSDFLILQTSSGDQSVMYFDKVSNTAKVTDQLDVPVTNFATMWTNNPNSAANWTETQVHVGSYNGNFSVPSSKYSGGSLGTTSTVFDSLPAGLNRPSRPAPFFRLMQTNLDIPDTKPNGEYLTGQSSVFYKSIQSYDIDNEGTPYNQTLDPTYNDNGQYYRSTYSSSHAKVNDIVIHDPVSVEDAMVISLPSSMDQRTPASAALGGNKQEGVVEYEKTLDPNYRQNIIGNGNAEYINPNSLVAGWNTWTSTPDNNVRFTSRTGDMWVVSGLHSFEINTTPNVGGNTGPNYIGVYYKDVTIKPNTNYQFEGKISCHRCTGNFYLDVYNSDGSLYQTVGGGSETKQYTPTNHVTNFTTGPNVNRVRIHIVKGNGQSDSTAGVAEYMFADDLKLKNMSIQEFIPVEGVYTTQTIPNPDYIPANSGTSKLFNYTGSSQTFTAPSAGTYTLEAWGASGGNAQYTGDPGYGARTGGRGSYATGKIDLTAGQQLTVNVGGQGSHGQELSAGCDAPGTRAGGWNGGGAGGTYSGSGGGASDIRGSSGTPTALYAWDFTGGSTNGFSGVSAGAGYGIGYSGSDTWIVPPAMSFVGSSTDYVELIVKNTSNGPSGEFYISNEQGGPSESRVVRFAMTTGDTSYKTYIVPMGSDAGWAGHTINSIRMDIANSASSSVAYELKSIKVITSIAGGKLLVAGAGGGAGQQSFGGDGDLGGDRINTPKGSGGSGAPGVNANGIGGQGGATDDGGGGGGYFGGQGGFGGCGSDGGGGGGSSYVGTLSNTAIVQGNLTMPSPAGGTEVGHTGNGAVSIKSPPNAAVGTPTIDVPVLAGSSGTSIPAEAYITTAKQQNPAAPAGGFTPGNFVVLDYGFQLYFPNRGDFFGDGANGISATTDTRGKGFVDDMDVTEWTKEKYVQYDFNVIYNNHMYLAKEWIPLQVDCNSYGCKYDFYVPLADRERLSALVQWKSIAINGQMDNDVPTNKVRYGTPKPHAAKHSSLKRFNVDVVGRIGNMTIQDTGDFRYSNLFKMPLIPTEWQVQNVVKKVNQNQQNKIVGDLTDIRGYPVTAGTNYLDTWGLLGHLRQTPISFPLSPEKNNIPALQTQPIRLGYNTLSDIQTIGNYYGNLQIIPYYYALNLQNGNIQPVDIYMDVNSDYKPINKHGAAVPGWNPMTIHQHIVGLDWLGESGRRNVFAQEAANTNTIADFAQNTGGDTVTGKASRPNGSNYAYGTAQIMYATGRNRTYIGNTSTYGWDKNPGSRLPAAQYMEQAQRWHYTYALPSSAVAVAAGQPATQANIDAIRNKNTVIVMAADIKAVGDTYVLQYKAPNSNGNVNIAGTSWPLTSIPYPVINIYSSNKSSADDLDVFGTH
ncbi:hypothetical protein QFZ81_000177 [Paenibacillus sp. V4I9]|uniref:glycine rich domain-containing protein n=1 Tax=Paenibacillus sp. V4I9 TaxID=3042308 RepID=UPI0027833F3B|nr:glycine rich domain-containing protein [Paenibacillus sp. V4I9]MDQ0885089.1 hypothetical protein [Paenibacillus sp. V4I9]